MNYERMWDPEPPSGEDLLEGQIRGSGGVIVKTASEAPGVEHWVIVHYGIFRTVPVTYVAYLDKVRWLAEVKRLAAYHRSFTALGTYRST